jgi:hypothetical protein
MSRFDYVLETIKASPFSTKPFRHLYIDGLFSAEDFSAIVRSPTIDIKKASSDEELIELMHAQNFRAIPFPGTTSNLDSYMTWRKERAIGLVDIHSACEGVGLTMRLQTAPDGIIGDLDAFFQSDAFWDTVAEKFSINRTSLKVDTGLQKYLDGYEISPHCDIRRKALTMMVNINPASNSHEINYHTHYLKLKPERSNVNKFWKENADQDRCWVPWHWCDTVKRQTKNNSVVFFSPTNDTLHAVRAHYDHLVTQRTQYYGNIWYSGEDPKTKPEWQDLEALKRSPSFFERISRSATNLIDQHSGCS